MIYLSRRFYQLMYEEPDEVLNPAPEMTNSFFLYCRNDRNEWISSSEGCWVRYDGITRFAVLNASVIVDEAAVADDSAAEVVSESILEVDEYLKDILL